MLLQQAVGHLIRGHQCFPSRLKLHLCKPAGLLAFPPKDLQYRFLCRFTPVFYIRQRDYSKVSPGAKCLSLFQDVALHPDVTPVARCGSGALLKKHRCPVLRAFLGSVFLAE